MVKHLALLPLIVFSLLVNRQQESSSMKKQETSKQPRVTGIGGVFFKSKDPASTRSWYGKHLGFHVDQYGTNFEWRHADDSTRKGFTLWAPFKESTKYFHPSPKQFMINFRVVNLEGLLDSLQRHGVTIIDSIQVFEYGKFAWILDPDSNKIELWEPIDEAYDTTVGQARTK